MTKRIPVFIALLAFLSAGVAPAQHRKPDNAPPPREPAPQAQPRDGQRARPRPAPPQRPGRVVVVPSPGWPWWGTPYPPGYPPYGFRVYTDWEYSHVRLDVEPEDAQVYVDGYYAGVVDNFDGVFQRLTLHAGPHLIEVRKDGYRPLAIELSLYPGQTVTYRRMMEPAGAGENAPATASVPPAFEEGAGLPPIDAPPGDVKFDVTPHEASIYADGFYVGIVDDFNGGQHLRLAQGTHHLTLMMEGYETLEVELSVDSENTITYRAAMKKVAAP
jgi:hypothetical protein